MELIRCKHFSVESEEIYVSGASVALRVPIRRCALAERMIGFISQTARGSQISHKLRIDMTPRGNQPGQQGAPVVTTHLQPTEFAAEAGEEKIRAAFGPDLEAIHQLECTAQRCKESCTPSYKLLLQHFDLHELADQETGVGCMGASD